MKIKQLKESVKTLGRKGKQLTEAEETLYVIRDSHGNQLSRPNPDDDELWDRVASMEARGRRGLCVVVYTGKKECLSEAEDVQYGVHSFSQDAIIFRGTEEECGKYIDSHKELWDDAEVYRMEPGDPHYKAMNETLDVQFVVSKYDDAFYNEDEQMIDCGSEATCKAIAKELGVGPDRTSNSPVAHEIWLDESKKTNESIEVATIADYITDHYEFDDIDDKYGCINSIIDSFKDEKTISWEELEQFIGAHNGRDKVEEALTENRGQPRSKRYTTYFNRIKRAIEKGDEETLQRTKEAIMYAPAKELKNSEASELMDMIKNRKITESVSGKYGEVKYEPRRDGMPGESAIYANYHLFSNDGKYTPYWAGERPMGSSYNSVGDAVKGIDAFIDRQRKDGKMLHMKPVNEASYGGAFDIADDQYFTKDDLMSFADEVLGHVAETFNGLYDIGGVWFEDGHVITQIVNDSGDEFEDKTKVDMRRIREPWHLKRMYAFPVAANIIKQIEENDADVFVENVQGMGEYSDKFHEYLLFLLDEHKEDQLPYLVLQLIRYCKEEDLKDLWFDRMNKVAQDNGFETSESIEEGIMDEFHKAQRYLDFEIPDSCKATADKLPSMTEEYMAAINKHCMRFKDVLDYYSTKASSNNEALEERFDGETHKVVAVAFDIIAPVEMTESEIEVELTDAINKSKVEVSGGYMEVHQLDESLQESVTTDAQPIETGAAVGMAAVVSDLIKDEYEAIDGYNSAIATAEAEGFEDAVKVLTDIQAEENLHVGQLQELMKMFDANADKVDEGQAEAEEQINNSAETPNNNIEESADMKKERWEEIYDSFKTVEKELNQDGEAVTAVVDQMYRDNKDDPDYKKAYDKWASGE